MSLGDGQAAMVKLNFLREQRTTSAFSLKTRGKCIIIFQTISGNCIILNKLIALSMNFFLAAHHQTLLFSIITAIYKVRLQVDQLDLTATICSSHKKKTLRISSTGKVLRQITQPHVSQDDPATASPCTFHLPLQILKVSFRPSRQDKSSLSLSLKTLPTYLSQT